MSTFGSLLVQNQIVGVNEIEQALQHQVIYGGDLATNLLELGLADEHVLTEFMARSLNMPAAAIDLLDSVSMEEIQSVPWSVIEAVEFLPIRFVRNRLQIVVTVPLDEPSARDLAFLLGCEFAQSFSLGFRLAMARNRIYGIPIPARLSALQKRFAPEFEPDLPPLIPRPPVDEEAAMGQESGDSSFLVESGKGPRELDSTVRIFVPTTKSRKASDVKFLDVPDDYRQPDAEKASPDSPSENIAESTVPADSKPPSMSRESRVSALLAIQDRPSAVNQVSGPPFDVEEALAALQEAADRDAVIDLVMEHSARAFRFAVLLVVHGNVAQGRAAVHNRVRSDKVEFLSIPLDRGGMFQTVYESHSCHLGPLGTSETEQEILDTLKRPWPKNCVIIPVTLRNRVVSILYGDSGSDGVDADLITDFTRLTQAVADAFERILLARKEKKAQAAPSEQPPPAPEKELETPKAPQPESAGRYHLTSEGAQENGDLEPDTASKESPIMASDGVSISKPTSVVSEPKTSADSVAQLNGAKVLPGQRPTPPAPSRLIETVESKTEIVEEVKTPEVRFSTLDEGTTQAVLEHLENHPSQTVSESRPTPTAESRPKPTGVVTTSPVVTVGRPSRTRSIVVEMKEEIARLVERILTPGRFDETAANLLLGIGDDALAKLISKFPGPLLADRYQQAGRLQRVGRHGPVLQTVLMFKKKAVPYLTELFESPDSDVRFYAVFMFSELIYPEAVAVLKARLFDTDRQIRALAVDVMRGFQNYPEYNWAMSEVVELLGSPKSGLDVKVIAAEALSALRTPESVETLIQMLDSVDTDLGERCHRALVRITFEDFGFSVPRWLVWHEKNRMRHRTEWAIDSVVHSKEGIRNAAISEMPTLVGDAVEWSNGPMDHKKRVELQTKLRDWWIREGRALFPGQGSE